MLGNNGQRMIRLRTLSSNACSHYHQLILEWVKRRPFYRLHVAYFLSLAMVGSFIIWVSPKPPPPSPSLSSSSSSSSSSSRGISYIDALYNAVSALTVTGLSSVEMHRFSLFDQVVLVLLMLLGGQVFTSMIPLFLRRQLMKQASHGDVDQINDQQFSINQYCRAAMQSSSSATVQEILPLEVPELILTNSKLVYNKEGIRRVVSMPAIITANDKCKRTRSGTCSSHDHHVAIDMGGASPDKLRTDGNGLSSRKQDARAELEALSALLWVVGGYWVGVQLAGYVVCQLFFLASPRASGVLSLSHVNPSFFSLFSAVSAFANSGFIQLDQNLVPLQRGAAPLLLCLAALILLGNTLYAPTLRLLIFSLHRISRGPQKRAYAYLLQNPRRCYTHLFPRFQTLWLLLTVLFLNCSQMACIYALDWNSSALQGLGAGDKLVDGLFQSVSTRNAGMSVINVAALSPPTLFLFVGMMYIAVYPVYVTRQHSKERMKKPINSKDDLESDIFVQCSNLLARDSMLFVILFFICLFEKHAIQHDPLNFSIFNIVFEVISGYGNVGISTGYTCNLRPLVNKSLACSDITYSFSGKWTTLGKLTMVVVMMLGRHRALPDDSDWAIAPPSS